MCENSAQFFEYNCGMCCKKFKHNRSRMLTWSSLLQLLKIQGLWHRIKMKSITIKSKILFFFCRLVQFICMWVSTAKNKWQSVPNSGIFPVSDTESPNSVSATILKFTRTKRLLGLSMNNIDQKANWKTQDLVNWNTQPTLIQNTPIFAIRRDHQDSSSNRQSL